MTQLFAHTERLELHRQLAETGPDAPTLIDDWNTGMLAAHIVLRERRPDAAVGLLVPAFAGHTERVQRQLAARPWKQLLTQIAEGPPRWHPSRWSTSVAEKADLVEFYVHGEDVRRARAGWQPRTLGAAEQDALWQGVRRIGRLIYRGSPLNVVLRRDTGEEVRTGGSGATVTVSGPASEVLLHAFGRDREDASRTSVTVTGEEAALRVYASHPRGL